MWFFKFNENLKCDFFYLGSWDYKDYKMSYKMNLQNKFCKFHNEFKHGMFLVFCIK